MKLRKYNTLSNDVFTVTLITEDWSQADTELMIKFGEPEIDLGGSFTSPTFTLPSNLVKIKSESPFVQAFDYRDSTAAEARANKWAADITTRITSAVATLRGQTDTFTGESVTNI